MPAEKKTLTNRVAELEAIVEKLQNELAKRERETSKVKETSSDALFPERATLARRRAAL